MNDLYALEPTALRTANELRFFLAQFGPPAGRYLAALPKTWFDEIEKSFQEARPVEQQRILALLRRAREGSMVLSRPRAAWSTLQDWRYNVSSLATSPQPLIKAGIVNSEILEQLPAGLVSVNEFSPGPTCEMEMPATADAFVRLTSVIIELKGDIHLVDPYMDPCRGDMKSVLAAMMDRMADAPVNSLTIWVRAREIIGNKARTLNELEQALMLAGAKARARVRVTYNLLDDSLEERMHARCFFSIKGGVSSDQGFQVLRTPSKTKVSPMSEALLDAYIARYHEGKHAPIEHTVSVVIGPRQGAHRQQR